MPEYNRGGTPYLNTALLATKAAAVTYKCRLFNIHIFNSGAAIAYVQFFDLASGDVTVGTTVPTFVRAIPAGAVVDGSLLMPLQFDVAVTIAATTTATGSTAPGTALLINFDSK